MFINIKSILLCEVKMVFKCCVPGCRSGYDGTSDGISMHKFPSATGARSEWIRRIHRDSFSPNINSRVCSVHFKEDDFVTARMDSNVSRKRSKSAIVRKRVLKPSAYPSIFPNQPSYFTSPASCRPSTSALSESRIARENETISKKIKMQKEEDKITCLDDLRKGFDICHPKPDNFFIRSTKDGNNVLILSLNENSEPIDIDISVKISEDLTFIAWKNRVLVPRSEITKVMQFSNKIMSFLDLCNLLALLNNYDVQSNSSGFIVGVVEEIEKALLNLTFPDDIAKKLTFITEQLVLLTSHKKLYTTETLVTAFVWHSFSSACYRAILKENVLTLPSERTLRRLSSRFSIDSNSDMISYLKLRRSKLNDFEAHVSLIFDEIYIYQTLDYQNGKFVGIEDEGGALATTVLCFMLNSLAGKYCDVIAMIPLSHYTLDKLNKCFLATLEAAMSSGFEVVLTVCDNHTVNRQFLKRLCGGQLQPVTKNPLDDEKILHILIDPTHTVKNIYNNFQNRVNFNIPQTGTIGPYKPTFSHIRNLFNMELKQHLKLAHKITQACLNPSNIQRTSAKLAFSVFNESTANALLYYSRHGQETWTDTANFVKLISNLIKIINVKNKSVGYRKQDELRKPISSTSSDQLVLLRSYAAMFKAWKASNLLGLSSETFAACILMCDSLCCIAEYLLNKGFHYVLLGHCQSDQLEHRFGRYRQMSGANYFVSFKQLLESEHKLKVTSLLKHSRLPQNLSDVLDFRDSDLNTSPSDVESIFPLDYELLDLNLTKSEMQVVFFVAGYIGHNLKKKVNCETCKNWLTTSNVMPSIEAENPSEYFVEINRGNLTSPSNNLYLLCVYAYCIFNEIKSSDDFSKFLSSFSPRTIFINSVVKFISSSSSTNSILCICQEAHPSIVQRVLTAFFNTLSCNLVRNLKASSTIPDSQKLKKIKSVK